MKDYIEREAALAYAKKAWSKGLNVVEYLEEVPAADVRPVVRGEWLEENTRPKSSQFYCSVCHRTAYDPQPTRSKGWVKRCRYAYCPNCGSYNRGDENG